MACIVTVYTTGPDCARCNQTKSVMDKRGVPWVEVDITQEPAAREYVISLGYVEAPVCVVEDGTGEDHWSGFRLGHIERVARIVATPNSTESPVRGG